jgi:hypothetical protein
MDGGERIEVTVLGGLEEIEAAEWDACAAPEGDPPRDPSPPTASFPRSRLRAPSDPGPDGNPAISSPARAGWRSP